MKAGAKPEYTAKFTGVVYKTLPTDRWKWHTFEFDQIVQTGGIVQVCHTVTP